jgi:hypothetical protein
MCKVEDTKKVMMEAGWVLESEDSPGVYVRSSETIKGDSFDWKGEPKELLEFIGRSASGTPDRAS